MSYEISSERTKFATSATIAVAVLFFAVGSVSAAFEDIIREAARRNGLVPAAQTYPTIDDKLAKPGKTLFEFKALSLNGNIACQSCHLDAFGSADGIPNAVAVGGQGEGAERVMGRGGIIPRNTLPFWGRGGKGFNVFFWDGKVDFSNGKVSQFGGAAPSNDPLVTAVHLPVAEIREMLAEDEVVLANKTESLEAAEHIYSAVMSRLRENEPDTIEALAKVYSIKSKEVNFEHVAESLANFIRHRFRLRDTRFHSFVFNGESLTDEELRGAQLFYGKGKCAICHSGPYLSDFQFHAIPFPQIGFGKNGFGVDYGRFNVTHNPDDLYKFRTPPLFNVERTAPYGHSGSVATMREAIVFHFDPLRGVDLSKMKTLDRHEYYKRLSASADAMTLTGYLDDPEVDALVAFLKTLSFDSLDS